MQPCVLHSAVLDEFSLSVYPSSQGELVRHSTRNFPNREGSKVNNGQIASVALMDARSIAATAANQGYLTAATDIDVDFKKPKYFFDSAIYENRVYNAGAMQSLRLRLNSDLTLRTGRR